MLPVELWSRQWFVTSRALVQTVVCSPVHDLTCKPEQMSSFPPVGTLCSVKLLSLRRAATRRLHSFHEGRAAEGRRLQPRLLDLPLIFPCAFPNFRRQPPGSGSSSSRFKNAWPFPPPREPSGSEEVIRAAAARRCASSFSGQLQWAAHCCEID